MSNHQGVDAAQVSKRIMMGLGAGVVLGVIANAIGEVSWLNWILENILGPIGTVFLRSLYMIVVPLVFASITVGVANLGSGEHVGRLGWRLAAFYLGTTLLAVMIGQTMVSVIQPGVGVDPELIASAKEGLSQQVNDLVDKSAVVGKSLWPGIVATIVPKNIFDAMAGGNMLGVIFVSIVFGLALLKLPNQKSQAVIDTLDAIAESCIAIVSWLMSNFAPFAIAALMTHSVAKLGIDIMGNVAKYMVTVMIALLLQFLLVYPLILKVLVRVPLREFWKRAMPAYSTAFSTASSSATMPTTIHTLEKRFGVPESITSFSVPIGTTVNMDGSAIFAGIAAIFVAQVFGVELGWDQRMTLVVMLLTASIGAAGVPGGLYPILMSVMISMGIPAEGMVLVLGVDRILDMCRTAVNVTGDITGTLYLARVERVPLTENWKKIEV